ncbi:MAG: hypothetical protein CME70_09650 [Halobacteriovorax sp.]|nr:hypothetical protein [Halobacteriovorax sp.]
MNLVIKKNDPLRGDDGGNYLNIDTEFPIHRSKITRISIITKQFLPSSFSIMNLIKFKLGYAGNFQRIQFICL